LFLVIADRHNGGLIQAKITNQYKRACLYYPVTPLKQVFRGLLPNLRQSELGGDFGDFTWRLGVNWQVKTRLKEYTF